MSCTLYNGAGMRRKTTGKPNTASSPPVTVCLEPRHIAPDFRRLSRRFQNYARRSRKANHLCVNVSASAVQAGRLLVTAIDAGAFPKSSREKNGEWWDRREGRVPGGPLAVVGSIKWNVGDPSPDQASEYLSAAAGTLDAQQFAVIWTFAVGSWLVKAFPHSFREGAASWDWSHILTDDEGRAVGRDGKRLVRRWYKNGKPLPRNFKWSPQLKDGKYARRLEGQFVRREELYDESDWLAHLCIRAEVYSDACMVLSELTGPEKHSDEQPDELVTLNQVAPLVGLHKRTLERYVRSGSLPQPDIRGGNGKANKWHWTTIRPALQKLSKRLLPERFPGSHLT